MVGGPSLSNSRVGDALPSILSESVAFDALPESHGPGAGSVDSGQLLSPDSMREPHGDAVSFHEGNSVHSGRIGRVHRPGRTTDGDSGSDSESESQQFNTPRSQQVSPRSQQGDEEKDSLVGRE